MSKIFKSAIAALSVCVLLSATNVQAQQAVPGREPPGREPSGDPKIPRKMIQEPIPFYCGAILVPCAYGPLRPDQHPNVDPHEPTKPNPKDPTDPNDPPPLPKPQPKPHPTPVPPPPQPNPNEGPVNKPGNADEDW